MSAGRAGSAPGSAPDFYFQDPIATALGEYDFRTVFRRIRMATAWSQQTLAEVTGLEQSRVSAIERGVRQLRDVALVARVTTRLWIPAILLGFGATVGAAGADGRKLVSWVDRRDFVQHVGTLALSATGVAGFTGLDVDRLMALLSYADPPGTRHIGLADVEALERATAEYERVLHTYGGGYACDTAIAQFRATLPLLKAQAEPAVRARLHTATAHLALQTGWMSFDLEQQEIARRLFLAGLEIAQGAQDPVTTDLTGHLCMVMAQQALYLQHPDEALRLVRIGQAVSQGTHQVSPSTATALPTNLAFAYAAKGDIRHTELLLGDAEQEFTEIDLTTASPWACVDGPVKLVTWQGHARYELGRRDDQLDALPSCADTAPHTQLGARTDEQQPRCLGAARTPSAHRRLAAWPSTITPTSRLTARSVQSLIWSVNLGCSGDQVTDQLISRFHSTCAAGTEDQSMSKEVELAVHGQQRLHREPVPGVPRCGVPVTDRESEQLRRAVHIGAVHIGPGARLGQRGTHHRSDLADHPAEPGAERVAHHVVGVGLPPEQVGQHRRGVQPGVEGGHQAAQAARDVTAHHDVAVIEVFPGQPPDQRHQQVRLAAEVVVHQSLGNSGTLGDPRGRSGVEPLLGEQFLRCREDPFPSRGILPGAQCWPAIPRCSVIATGTAAAPTATASAPITQDVHAAP